MGQYSDIYQRTSLTSLKNSLQTPLVPALCTHPLSKPTQLWPAHVFINWLFAIPNTRQDRKTTHPFRWQDRWIPISVLFTWRISPMDSQLQQQVPCFARRLSWCSRLQLLTCRACTSAVPVESFWADKLIRRAQIQWDSDHSATPTNVYRHLQQRFPSPKVLLLQNDWTRVGLSVHLPFRIPRQISSTSWYYVVRVACSPSSARWAVLTTVRQLITPLHRWTHNWCEMKCPLYRHDHAWFIRESRISDRSEFGKDQLLLPPHFGYLQLLIEDGRSLPRLHEHKRRYAQRDPSLRRYILQRNPFRVNSIGLHSMLWPVEIRAYLESIRLTRICSWWGQAVNARVGEHGNINRMDKNVTRMFWMNCLASLQYQDCSCSPLMNSLGQQALLHKSICFVRHVRSINDNSPVDWVWRPDLTLIYFGVLWEVKVE